MPTPQLSPVDDPKTYLTIAQNAYRAGATNPKLVNAQREQQAGSGGPLTPGAFPATPDPTSQSANGITFTKAFTPQERAAQRQALLAKLQQMDAEDAANKPAPAASAPTQDNQ
jgi:hypothetical protein